MSVRTVQRYERCLGLPVRRPAGNSAGSVVATKAELDAWVSASPIREAFHLVTLPQTSSEVEDGLQEMRRLRAQMNAIRTELRGSRAELRESVLLLHKSIENLHGEIGPDGEESSQPRSLQRDSRTKTILDFDTSRRKPS